MDRAKILFADVYLTINAIECGLDTLPDLHISKHNNALVLYRIMLDGAIADAQAIENMAGSDNTAGFLASEAKAIIAVCQNRLLGS